MLHKKASRQLQRLRTVGNEKNQFQCQHHIVNKNNLKRLTVSGGAQEKSKVMGAAF